MYDVDGKADLVEEVMRIHGEDNIRPAAAAAPSGSVNGRRS
jgi:phenylalanyl-tRNA synthetase beta chain